MSAPRILIIQLRQLGDILLTTPVTRALREQFPESTIDFLTHPMGKLILDGNPYISSRLTYNPKASWTEIASFLKSLRQKRYDYVFDFMNNPRSALFTLVTGSKNRYSFRSKRRVVYSETALRPLISDYIIREKFSLLSLAAMNADNLAMVMPWGPSDLGPVTRLFAAEPCFLQAPLRIALSPTHRREERRWPVARYAELAEHLVKTYQANILWLWGPGEESVIKEVRALCKVPTLVAPKTTFREMAALMAQCDLFIGNSNGPSHVAIACHCPSLQIHGPTEARAWCPQNVQHGFLQAGPDNIPPGGAIETIQTTMVYAKVASMMPSCEAHARLRDKEGFIARTAKL